MGQLGRISVRQLLYDSNDSLDCKDDVGYHIQHKYTSEDMETGGSTSNFDETYRLKRSADTLEPVSPKKVKLDGNIDISLYVLLIQSKHLALFTYF